MELRAAAERSMTKNLLPGRLVSTKWLAENLGERDLRILDCTTVQATSPEGGYVFEPGLKEWRAGHIPGAVFCDVLNELRDPDNPLPLMMPKPEAFARAMEALGVGEGTRVILYDRGANVWAARVWWSLRVFGFDNAAILDGGWRKWTAENRTVSTEAPPRREARFQPRFRRRLLASKDEVLESVKNGGAALVHSLSREEFKGEVTRMPRPGRISSSVNIPAAALLDPVTNTYLPLSDIKARFERAGVFSAPRIITYCGGGVAACGNALALTLIGREDVAVYDGSLAEWTADPDAPMETG